MKKIWIISLFPEYFYPFEKWGVISSLFGKQIELKIINPRDYVPFKYKSIDDSPYGGGPGMLIRPDIMKLALEQGILVHYPGVTDLNGIKEKLLVVFTSPRGLLWNDKLARDFCKCHLLKDSPRDLVFICGRYEGLDQRFVQKYVDLELSIGDYVLSGGEIAVMAILDSALRFVPGLLGNASSTQDESFVDGQLEFSQYTRPRIFEDMEVPIELLSGNHKEIAIYKKLQSKKMTLAFRPDLLS